ncbi:MAG: rubrerythrin, partial [Spirochaetia bacterium]|nr:rubrerythrin [Spirochaetia bacterium]
ESKADQEAVARAAAAENPGAKKLARALQKSMRILAEDCAREGGYMLPQSTDTQSLLSDLAQTEDQQIQELAMKLLEK